jgi:uncharacterized MnhB-related membrane protein
MTIAATLEMALAVLVLGVAVWTIAARETFVAVVGFVAYGLLLALVWVRLDAVDVALTEVAIGGGLSGVLLLGAAARLRATEVRAAAEDTGKTLRVGAALLSAMVAAALAAGVLLLPDPAPTLAPAVAANVAATGLGNPVTSVLMALARSVWPDHESPAAPQDPRLQSARQRRIHDLRRHRAPGCRGRLRRRPGAAGARHHRYRCRLFRDGARGCAAAAAVRGRRIGDVAPLCDTGERGHRSVRS